MLFGQEMRPIADFLPWIAIHIDGASEDMLADFAMSAAIQFMRDSQLVSEINCFDIDPCINSYKLHTKLRPYEVLSIRVFVNDHEQPLHDHDISVDIDHGTLYVEPHYCCAGMRVEVELSVVPWRDSSEVPALIYEDWMEAVVAYTLSRVYRQPDNQWYNNPAAEEQIRIYQELVRKARINRIARKRPLQMRLAGRR